jgi:flagellin
MAVVNTNISASIAQSALMKNDRALGKAMEQLSTGSRINSAADDAAGLAISTRMTSQINGLNVGIKNANDGISMINTAEGALSEVTNMLQRMRELALEASNGTTDVNDRTYLNKEYQQLVSEIQRVATKTEWNGRTILNNTADGSSSGVVEFQIGVDTGTTLSVDFGNFTQQTGSGIMASFGSGAAAVTISASTTALAQTTSSKVVGAIDSAIDDVNLKRAEFGAATNRLTHTVDNLTNVVVNAESTRSAIQDTDYAAATSELARSQIIAQAGTAMLAQANQMPQTVLALLQ